jgi:hypothetical protein
MFMPPTVTQRCDPDMSLVSNVVRRGAVYYFRRNASNSGKTATQVRSSERQRRSRSS